MMETEQQKRTRGICLSLSLKCSAILLLLSLSVLIIACGESNTIATTSLGAPQVTVTISFNDAPIPTAAPYLCGAWTTNTTPAFNPGHQIPVYAHFIHNVSGNPVGVSGANAQATVVWANGERNTTTGTTGSDGLAVFYFTIPNQPDMVNKNNLVLISFAGPKGETCKVDNQHQPAAYFTLIPAPQPTSMPQSILPPLPPLPILPTLPNGEDVTPPSIDFPPDFN